jgi:hypothetical protein
MTHHSMISSPPQLTEVAQHGAQIMATYLPMLKAAGFTQKDLERLQVPDVFMLAAALTNDRAVHDKRWAITPEQQTILASPEDAFAQMSANERAALRARVLAKLKLSEVVQ